MGRNDGGHHHHNRGNHNRYHHTDHRQHRQQQQSHTGFVSGQQHQDLRSSEAFDSSQLLSSPAPFHLSPFGPSPFIQQFPPFCNQPIQQQHDANQQQQLLQPQQPYLGIDISGQQNLFMQAMPLMSQPSMVPPDPTNWYCTNPNLNITTPSSTGVARPIEQTLPADALNRLQLPASQITETGIIPNIPYYELPAGLMVPLIAPSQREYKPINPADIRLPLPKFPDESFLRSIDCYYGSDGKARDNDGWDREFINTYIAQKEALAEG